ncbi:MAG: AAC(3) family N-acetyltransferase [Carboxylicivirga sp.]|nr:AAC(3) family N-acetyltransferase [Carboxylicivirga sp.]
MNKSHHISKEVLIKDLERAGIPKGALLHVKASLKAIGQIDGGAATLLHALLETVGPQGTIVVDAFVTCYPLPLNTKHAQVISTEISPSYAGALANAMIQHPHSVRSKHPIQRFCAIGKLAHDLMDKHTPESGAYDVFSRLVELDAINISIGRKAIGVGTTHLAVEKMGFIKKPSNMGLNYRTASGEVKTFVVNWNGGCSRGFSNFLPLYESAGCLKWVKIGNADAAITSMKGTLEVELKKLIEDASFYFCDDPTCKDCRLNWEHSTGSYFKVKFHSLITIIKRKLNILSS